jgi:2'-hydroxyisoflavone reductase
MRILVLGGTVFVGRAITDAALTAGHQVVHFNRGKSSPPDARVETIHGDRTQEPFPATLTARAWDAVIDTSGYLPQVVEKSARALRDARRYLFVSSVSAYSGPDFREDGALKPPPDPLPDAMTPETYGGLKTACEAVVQSAFGSRSTIVRPGLIVGPHDPTDRFTYWPVRVARGGAVAAPGRPSRTVQFIDVRDLGEWIVKIVEAGVSGAFNATGPARPVPMSTLLETCREVSGSDARLEWVDEAVLERERVGPWKDMPLWIPETEPHVASFMDIPIDRAVATGLEHRPLARTIADTLEWARSRPATHAWQAGLDPQREAALLAATLAPGRSR